MANQEVTHLHESNMKQYNNYSRNYMAVGVMWGIFTICFAIINLVVFVQPQWIGDTEDSVTIGFFGLFQYCELFISNQDLVCTGRFDDFTTIASKAFQAATFFVGISALIILICICCMLLFAFIKPDKVFYAIGCMQLLSGLCMFLGCIIFPAGWDNEHVKRICGSNTEMYYIGDCGIRWAYILAIVGIFDVLVLAILAFVMASRYARRRDYMYGANFTKSELNGYTMETESRASKPSMIIQPVLAVQEPSEYSTNTKRSRKGDFAL